jgi:hypothetical protein
MVVCYLIGAFMRKEFVKMIFYDEDKAMKESE